MRTKKGKSAFKRPTGKAREKYIGIRAGLSDTSFKGRIEQQMFKSFFSPHLRNERETMALMKLTGYLNLLKKVMVWTATRENAKKFFQMAEKERFDKKIPNRADAMARFLTDKKLQRVPTDIPPEFMAKPTTPYYPKPGSSKGKQKTIQKGAQQVQLAFKRMVQQLFAIGDGLTKQTSKKLGKSVGVTVTRRRY